jgi:hypothetical protein
MIDAKEARAESNKNADKTLQVIEKSIKQAIKMGVFKTNVHLEYTPLFLSFNANYFARLEEYLKQLKYKVVIVKEDPLPDQNIHFTVCLDWS